MKGSSNLSAPGLITTDLEGNIYTFNAAATEITGFKVEEMREKPIYSLVRRYTGIDRAFARRGRERRAGAAFRGRPGNAGGFCRPDRLQHFAAVLRGKRVYRPDRDLSGPDRNTVDGRKRSPERPAGGGRAGCRRARARDPKPAGRDARSDPGAGIEYPAGIGRRPT